MFKNFNNKKRGKKINKQVHLIGKEVVMTNLHKKNGFTLVELMIVIGIVGVLAAIAVPIYTSNIKKAKMSEADAALGTIRTQLRIYYGENGSYPATANVVDLPFNIKASELDGRYFQNTAYTYTKDSDSTYTITCAAGEVLDLPREMDQAGYLTGGIE